MAVYTEGHCEEDRATSVCLVRQTLRGSAVGQGGSWSGGLGLALD